MSNGDDKVFTGAIQPGSSKMRPLGISTPKTTTPSLRRIAPKLFTGPARLVYFTRFISWQAAMHPYCERATLRN
jgi:hypothetical protein